MTTVIIFCGIIFTALCIVCLIGTVNIVRAYQRGDPERLRTLLWSGLIVGIFTFSIGFFLFSPGHNMRVAQIITMAALVLNAAYWFDQSRRSEDASSQKPD